MNHLRRAQYSILLPVAMATWLLVGALAVAYATGAPDSAGRDIGTSATPPAPVAAARDIAYAGAGFASFLGSGEIIIGRGVRDDQTAELFVIEADPARIALVKSGSQWSLQSTQAELSPSDEMIRFGWTPED